MNFMSKTNNLSKDTNSIGQIPRYKKTQPRIIDVGVSRKP